MASGPYWNPKRGTWSVQYRDGDWRKVVVVRKRPGWNPGDPRPKVPPEAHAELARLAKVEKAAKKAVRRDAHKTLKMFLMDHVDTYKGLSRSSTKVAVDSFLAWCDERKIAKVEEVTRKVAQEWIDQYAASEEIAVQTSKNRIGRLAPAWTRAIVAEKLEVNPWKHVEPKGTAKRRPRGSWTLAQFDKLLKVARPWLRDILIVGTYTGIRISALSNLLWSDIEWPEASDKGFGWINIREEINKTEAYRIPVHPKLHEVLARRLLHRSLEHDRVICGAHGRPTSRSITATSIRRACARAKLPEPGSPNHRMRRTFGRWAVHGHLTGEPVPIYTVSRWLGHASVGMTQKYLDIDDQDSTRFMIGPE